MAFSTGRQGIEQIISTPAGTNPINTQIDEDAMFSDLDGSHKKNVAYTQGRKNSTYSSTLDQNGPYKNKLNSHQINTI